MRISGLASQGGGAHRACDTLDCRDLKRRRAAARGQVLQTLLAECWSQLDKRLVRRLLGGIEAMSAGRQVVLMEMARQYPGATHASAPLKALDRLLSNRRVQGLRQKL